MRVACETCGTKYTISDEKVRGRAYRVRCKKCGNTFIVRGDEPEPADGSAAREASVEAAAAGGAAEGAIWHVLIGGVQRGPLTEAEIGSLLQSGEATWDHYAWCDGLDAWKPIREIPELAALPKASPPPAAPEPVAGEPAVAAGEPAAAPEMLAAPAAEGPTEEAPAPAAGIFAPQSPAAGLFESPQGAAEGGELGGGLSALTDGPIAASTGGRAATGKDLFAEGGAAEAPGFEEPSDPQAMTGARHDTSVLFSLSNLQALAGGSPAQQQSTSSDEGGIPVLEGLRPLAPSPKSSAVDDLIQMGGASPFQPTLGAPVLATATPEREGRGLIYALFAVAFLLLTGIVVLVVLLLREPEPVASNEEGRSDDEQGEAAGAEPGEAGREPEKAAQEDAEERPTGEAEAEERETKRSGREREREREREHEREREPQREREPAKNDDPLEALMREVTKTAGTSAPRTSAPRTSAPAPEKAATPPRSEVMAAMNSVKGAVKACASGETGTASIRITFAGGSGRVTTARVLGSPFAGTAAGSCMARAVRSARVSPFSNPTLSVTFPFVMR